MPGSPFRSGCGSSSRRRRRCRVVSWGHVDENKILPTQSLSTTVVSVTVRTSCPRYPLTNQASGHPVPSSRPRYRRLPRRRHPPNQDAHPDVPANKPDSPISSSPNNIYPQQECIPMPPDSHSAFILSRYRPETHPLAFLLNHSPWPVPWLFRRLSCFFSLHPQPQTFAFFRRHAQKWVPHGRRIPIIGPHDVSTTSLNSE